MIHPSKTPADSRDEWRTPPWLLNYAAYLVRGFDYDTACNRINRVAPPIAYRYGDALKVPWKGKLFCNPPYSDIDPWVEKALQPGPRVVVMLIPPPNGEARYLKLCEAAQEIHIIGRVGFIGRGGREVKGNPRGSSLFILHDRTPETRLVIDRETVRNWPFDERGNRK